MLEPSKAKMIVKLPLLVLWLSLGALVVSVASALRLKQAPAMICRVHAGALRLFALRCDTDTEICTQPSTLYVANHVSYLDVFLLGSLVQASFVAKLEVSRWPVLGKLAGVQRTVFLERRTARARDQIKLLQGRLATGRLVLFPEGTSTPGTHVEGFKSSLFAAATPVTPGQHETFVQPIAIAYTHHAGHRMTQAERDRYAWYLPMEFGSHFLAALGMQSARAEVTFLPPVKVEDFPSRKACAAHCEEAIRRALLESLDMAQEHCPASYRPYSVRWKTLAQAASREPESDVAHARRLAN